MDKLVAFFKNVWFRRAIAVICWGYTAFMLWIAWLCFAYYFQFENPTPAFVLYLFINVAAVGLMILSRKQVITQVNSYILPPIVFMILFFGFGNWYIIIPPIVVMLVLFFVNASNETLKTVLGTMYLLLFVIGTAGHIGYERFMGNLSFVGPDLTERDTDYETLSESGEYRLVRYLDSSPARNTMTYYVEYTGDDITLPKGVAKKVFGCKQVHTAAYTSLTQNFVSWGTQTRNGKKVEILYVDGQNVRDNPYLVKEISSSDRSSKSSASSTTPSSAVSSSLVTSDNSSAQ